MKVTNNTSDVQDLKICLYKTNEIFDVIPVGGGVFIVPKEQSVIWTPNPVEVLPDYAVRGFKPAIFDRLLFKEDNVRVEEELVVTGSDGNYLVRRSGKAVAAGVSSIQG